MQVVDECDSPRTRGRPRSTDRDLQIREAAWKQIAEVGCAALTFEAIAQSIGCSRTTLYRRFASKADLVLHLLDETSLSFAPDRSDLAFPRANILAHARACVAIYEGDRGTAFVQIMSAARTDEAIASAVRSHRDMVVPRYFEPLQELAPNATPQAISFALHTLIGAILHHVATRGIAPTDGELECLVDAAIFMARAGSQT